MATPVIQVDQVRISGTSSGTPGVSRRDLWRANLLNLISAAGGSNPLWSLLSSPRGSVAAIVSPTSPTASFTPDKRGRYRFQLTTANGVVTMVVAVRFDSAGNLIAGGVTEPAVGERGVTENNYDVGGSPNARGWDDAQFDQFDQQQAMPRPAASVAALIADPNEIADTATRWLQSLSGSGDEGGGELYWDGASTAAHDPVDALVVQPGFGGGSPLATGRYLMKRVQRINNQRVAWKAPVLVKTTANITLSGAQTIDGVSVTAGKRVLVGNDQTTAADRGIYVCQTGAWTRAPDMASSADTLSGSTVYVISGTLGGTTSWQLQTAGAITLGSTALSFVNISAVGGSPTGPASGDLYLTYPSPLIRTISGQSDVVTILSSEMVFDATVSDPTFTQPAPTGDVGQQTLSFYARPAATGSTGANKVGSPIAIGGGSGKVPGTDLAGNTVVDLGTANGSNVSARFRVHVGGSPVYETYQSNATNLVSKALTGFGLDLGNQVAYHSFRSSNTWSTSSAILDLLSSAQISVPRGSNLAGQTSCAYRVGAPSYTDTGVSGTTSMSGAVLATLYVPSAPDTAGFTHTTGSYESLAVFVEAGGARFAQGVGGEFRIGSVAANVMRATDAFAATPDTAAVGWFGLLSTQAAGVGSASAGATWTATEQGMLNAVYSALRNSYGLLS